MEDFISMKKIIVGAIAAFTLLSATVAAHPMTYVIDLAENENGKTVAIPKNQWADNYQSTPNLSFTKQLKPDLPKAGDTIEVHYKFTSDVDLSVLTINVTDTSAQANYWLNLTGKDTQDLPPLAKDIKAGQTVEGVWSVVLEKDCLAKIECPLMYDDPNLVKMGYAKNGKAANLTFVATGVETTKPVPKVQRKAKTWKLDLNKIAAFIKIEADHPWVNGVADTKTISGWQAVVDIAQAFGGDLPIKGDEIVISYKGISDTDISLIKSQLIENTAAVNWWAVICEDPDDSNHPFAEEVVSGKKFKGSVKFKVSQDAQEGVSLALRCSADAMDHPAILKASK